MIVYFEGVDGSGKSTVVKTLKDRYGCKTAIGPDRISDKHQELLNWYDFDDRHRGDIRYLVDRGPITEFIYRLIRDDEKSYLALKDLDSLLYGNKIVFCETAHAYDRAMTRGEDNIVDEKLHAKIKKAYKDVIPMLKKFCKCDIYICNTNGKVAYTNLLHFINS